MKFLPIFLLFVLNSYSQNYFCTLRTSGGSQRSAPSLVKKLVQNDSVLVRYMLQTMDRHNPYTLIEVDSIPLDFKKPYILDFQTEHGSTKQSFRLLLSRSAGLVVKSLDEVTASMQSYEFMESSGAAISIKHRNGLITQVSCIRH